MNLSLQQSLCKRITRFESLIHSDCWSNSSVPPLCYVACYVTQWLTKRSFIYSFFFSFVYWGPVMSFGIREDYRSLYHPTLLVSEHFLFLPFTIVYGTWQLSNCATSFLWSRVQKSWSCPNHPLLNENESSYSIWPTCLRRSFPLSP